MFEEFLIVFSQSRARWILLFGFAIALALLIVGDYMTSQLQMEGMFAPLLEPMRAALHERYGRAALGIVGASLIGAWKAYRKDRKRRIRPVGQLSDFPGVMASLPRAREVSFTE